MSNVHRISGPTWGPPLSKMRQLYLSMILPIFYYGCAIWFLNDASAQWRLPQTIIDELSSIQYRCLIKIAGSYKGVASKYLHKELWIKPIDIQLESRAMAIRAKHLALRSSTTELQPWRPSSGKTPSKSKNLWPQHPYFVHDCRARDLEKRARERVSERFKALNDGDATASREWARQKVRGKATSACARIDAEKSAAKWWEDCRTEQQAKRSKHQPATWDDWGKENLRRYRGLLRPQSTSLFQCRTGVGPFASYLFQIKVSMIRPTQRTMYLKLTCLDRSLLLPIVVAVVPCRLRSISSATVPI